MKFCDLGFLLVIALLQISVQGNSNSNGNNTIQNQPNINTTHKTELNAINSTEETPTKNLPKESQNNTKTLKGLNTDLGQLTDLPLKGNEESKIEEGQNGKLGNSDTYIEECDPSNRCEDEKKRFTACLRVPGTDSLALSLLIENRGTESLNIDISAPDFVNLEQLKVELKSKEHKEVKVSLYKDSNNSKILLKSSQQSRCILTLPNTISIEPSRNLCSKFCTSFLLFFVPIISIILLIILTYLCVKFKKTHHESEKLEELLPVSTGGNNKMEFCEKVPERWDNNDNSNNKRKFCEKDPINWDNSNWGDNWDDEEAPLTPSKPFVKPLSKGLNSRRFNKDGWKD